MPASASRPLPISFHCSIRPIAAPIPSSIPAQAHPLQEFAGRKESEPALHAPPADLVGEQMASVKREADRRPGGDAGMYEMLVLGSDEQRQFQNGGHRWLMLAGAQLTEQRVEAHQGSLAELQAEVAKRLAQDLCRDGSLVVGGASQPCTSSRYGSIIGEGEPAAASRTEASRMTRSFGLTRGAPASVPAPAQRSQV